VSGSSNAPVAVSPACRTYLGKSRDHCCRTLQQ
jgi:hypothetical protein